MCEVEIQFTRLAHANALNLSLPRYQTDLASGMDVAAAVNDPVTMQPGQICLIPTGFAVAFPAAYELQVRPRSGLAVRHGIGVVNAPGTIDADYRGEVKVALINFSQVPFVINQGDRVAQLVLAPVIRALPREVTQLSVTARGEGGFGHTGV